MDDQTKSHGTMQQGAITIIMQAVATVFFVVTLIVLVVFSISSKRFVSPPSPDITPTPTISLQHAPSLYETKLHEGGNVTIYATPQQLIQGKPVVFEITFDSRPEYVNFDVTTKVSLVEISAGSLGKSTWDEAAIDTMGRSGTLTFSQNLPQTAAQVSLIFRDIAGVPLRTLSWEIAAQ